MTVEDMLSRMSARELTRWAAYEQAFGPLGPSYAEDLLAGIYEQLQAFNRNVEEDGPVQPFPRRHQYFDYIRAQVEAEQAEKEKTPEQKAAEIAQFGSDRWG